MKITTHVLDQASGIPAHGVLVRLERVQPDGSITPLGEQATDDDGRVRDLIPDGMRASSGRYRLTFDTGAYWHMRGVATFFPLVVIDFDVIDTSHYHVPLLMSPFGYSTYRGS
ncbi:MAG TPA: hydroxyisourate hydrolase [Gemmatimonadaceae bacterium]|nr:hydroxyisourate hydrolase [Gemmatimonadaceae bacterium]